MSMSSPLSSPNFHLYQWIKNSLSSHALFNLSFFLSTTATRHCWRKNRHPCQFPCMLETIFEQFPFMHFHSFFILGSWERRMALQAREVAWSGFITFFSVKCFRQFLLFFFACPLPFIVNVFLRRFIIQADFCSPLSCKKRQTFFALKF